MKGLPTIRRSRASSRKMEAVNLVKDLMFLGKSGQLSLSWLVEMSWLSWLSWLVGWLVGWEFPFSPHCFLKLCLLNGSFIFGNLRGEQWNVILTQEFWQTIWIYHYIYTGLRVSKLLCQLSSVKQSVKQTTQGNMVWCLNHISQLCNEMVTHLHRRWCWNQKQKKWVNWSQKRLHDVIPQFMKILTFVTSNYHWLWVKVRVSIGPLSTAPLLCSTACCDGCTCDQNNCFSLQYVCILDMHKLYIRAKRHKMYNYMDICIPCSM